MIPTNALRHILNTGEYSEDHEHGTITIIVSANEIYTIPVEILLIELKKFTDYHNKKTDGLEAEMEELFVKGEKHSHDECEKD